VFIALSELNVLPQRMMWHQRIVSRSAMAEYRKRISLTIGRFMSLHLVCAVGAESASARDRVFASWTRARLHRKRCSARRTEPIPGRCARSALWAEAWSGLGLRLRHLWRWSFVLRRRRSIPGGRWRMLSWWRWLRLRRSGDALPSPQHIQRESNYPCKKTENSPPGRAAYSFATCVSIHPNGRYNPCD